MSLVQTNQAVQVPAAATFTPSLSDSGKLHILAAQGPGMVITLPLPATGLHYRFMMGAIAGGIITVGTGAAGGVRGAALTLNSTVTAIITSVTMNFAATAGIGDYIDCYGMNATTYSVSGMSGINAGIAIV